MAVIKFPTSKPSSKPTASLVIHLDGTITSEVKGAKSPSDRKAIEKAIRQTISELLKRR